VNDKVSPAQVEAMEKWGVQREGSYDYLNAKDFKSWLRNIRLSRFLRLI